MLLLYNSDAGMVNLIYKILEKGFKNQMKKKRLIVGIVICLWLVICICMAIFNLPKQVEVKKNTACIRVPGEFKSEVKVLYNSEYVKQCEAGSVVTLDFEKDGYYWCSVNIFSKY